MINQQPQITPDELSAKWSKILNQAFIQIITLEKQLAAQVAFIQELTTNEAALEAELVELKSPPHKLSISAELADQGSAIIANEKEKAAP